MNNLPKIVGTLTLIGTLIGLMNYEYHIENKANSMFEKNYHTSITQEAEADSTLIYNK
jgi:hypothetical protein